MFYTPALRTHSYVPVRGFDRSFERFLAGSVLSGVKFEQSDAAWTVTLDLPGVAREQLAIEVDGAVVRVKTAAQAPRQYQAAYELPEAIDADGTSAKLENGVLVLTLAKKKPVVTSRSIEVQ